jgi:plastocyanin
MFRRFSFLFAILGLVFCLYYSGCGGSNPTSGGGDQTITVQIKDDFFDPKSIVISPGTTVRWVRAGNDSRHTVTDKGGAFNHAFPNSGDTFERKFTEADRTFNYVCLTHESMGMKGSVRVGEGAPPPDPGY